jgi:hypothetical protein
MRKLMLLLALLVGLTLIGCGPGPAIDLDGPGTVEGGEGPAEEPVSEETTTEPARSATVPNFKQKFTYEDGVAIEFIKIEKGKLTAKQAEEEYNEKVKAGQGFARFTIKITNGSKEVLPADLVYVNVSYGPDGTAPEMIYLGDESGYISGRILPEKSKSGVWGYAIPENYWGDVTFEISIQDDFEREPVIFTGSIK